jgi:hypothetical protein
MPPQPEAFFMLGYYDQVGNSNGLIRLQAKALPCCLR